MVVVFFFAVLTQFLQGGDSELFVVVVRQRRGAFAHDLGCDGLHWHLHWIHAADEGLEPLVGERRLTAIQLYDPVNNQEQPNKEKNRRAKTAVTPLLFDSPVQIVERMGHPDCHLHSGLRGQLLNGSIALLSKGLRVVLVRQASDLPFLKSSTFSFEADSTVTSLPVKPTRTRHLEKSGKDIGGLASDHKETRVELTEAGIQILQTLK